MKFQLHELAVAAQGKLCELWPDGSLLRDSQLTAKRGFSFSIDSRALQPDRFLSRYAGNTLMDTLILNRRYDRAPAALLSVRKTASRRSNNRYPLQKPPGFLRTPDPCDSG
jgi:hypothetical protein